MNHNHGSVQAYVMQISFGVAFSFVYQKSYINKSLQIVFHMQVEKDTHLVIIVWVWDIYSDLVA